MFNKTKVRSILELVGKDLSAREVSKVLSVSRNTVAEVQALYNASGKDWDPCGARQHDNIYQNVMQDADYLKFSQQEQEDWYYQSTILVMFVIHVVIACFDSNWLYTKVFYFILLSNPYPFLKCFAQSTLFCTQSTKRLLQLLYVFLSIYSVIDMNFS